MRALLVSPRCYPEVSASEPIGGGPISVGHVARALADAGVDVRLLSFVANGPRQDERHGGVPLTRLPIRRLRGLGPLSQREWLYREMTRGMRTFLREFEPDILHAFGGRALPGVAALSRRVGLPFVLTVNGPLLFCPTSVGSDRHGRDCLGCRGFRRLRAILQWREAPGVGPKVQAVLYWLYSFPHMANLARNVRQASLLLPISNGLARDLVRLGHPPDRIRTVHNPITVPARIPESARGMLGLSEATPVLMYAGRLVEEKGVQNILRVLPMLPEAVLLVIGGGRYEPALRSQTAELRLGARVRFLGVVPNEALGPYYAAADVVIMAGWFYEALGRMLMEACAHGVAVIGTNVGGIPDVIEDGRNGLLLHSRDPAELCTHLRTVLDSPGLSRKMGAHGRAKMARDFAPETSARGLMQAYHLALERRGGGRASRPAPAAVEDPGTGG